MVMLIERLRDENLVWNKFIFGYIFGLLVFGFNK